MSLRGKACESSEVTLLALLPQLNDRRLKSRSRTKMTNGRINTMVTADSAYLVRDVGFSDIPLRPT